MDKQISQRTLRNESGAIMREIERGETFVVTRNGVPIAELGPLHRNKLVRAEVATALFSGAPRVEFGRLREDLDRIADPTASPRA